MSWRGREQDGGREEGREREREGGGERRCVWTSGVLHMWGGLSEGVYDERTEDETGQLRGGHVTALKVIGRDIVFGSSAPPQTQEVVE